MFLYSCYQRYLLPSQSLPWPFSTATACCQRRLNETVWIKQLNIHQSKELKEKYNILSKNTSREDLGCSLCSSRDTSTASQQSSVQSKVQQVFLGLHAYRHLTTTPCFFTSQENPSEMNRFTYSLTFTSMLKHCIETLSETSNSHGQLVHFSEHSPSLLLLQADMS